MALWKPDATAVGKSEFIGQRLFEREGLKGAKDQKRPEKTFEIYHFEETRDDREVSVDRLGQTSVDGKVKSYLNPRAHHAATLLHKKEFQGWAVTQAKAIQSPPNSYQIIPPAIAGEAGGALTEKGDPLTENKFHAHIAIPERLTPHEMAVMLAHIFSKDYRVEAATPAKKEQGWLSAVGSWFRKLWQRCHKVI
jgi:hypothetical protein